MSQVLQQLIELLDVKAIETNVYIGRSHDLGFGHLFGGQVLGQALVAASRTVGEDRFCHSLQGYFLRTGNPSEAIYYEVDLIRSGRSFSTRRVVAKQGGVAIFSMSASFHIAESGFEHQSQRPPVRGPEGIESELDMARKLQDRLAPEIREKFTAERAIEIRVVDQVDPFAPSKREAVKYSWMRTHGKLPDDPLIHQAMLAYASDFGLASTSLLPHGYTFYQQAVQVVSIDHCMWFHRPCRFDEWVLHATDSPSATGARGMNRGQIYSEKGDLVASVAQEGLMRKIRKKPKAEAEKSPTP